MEQKGAFSHLCGCICKDGQFQGCSKNRQFCHNVRVLETQRPTKLHFFFHFHHHKMCWIRINCSCVSYLSVSFPCSCSWKYLFVEFTLKISLFGGYWVRVFKNTTAEHIQQQYRRYLGNKGRGKGKVIPLQARCGPESVPLQAWTGPEGSRRLRFPDYVTKARDGGKVVSLTHRPPLPAGNTPGTHFD